MLRLQSVVSCNIILVRKRNCLLVTCVITRVSPVASTVPVRSVMSLMAPVRPVIHLVIPVGSVHLGDCNTPGRLKSMLESPVKMHGMLLSTAATGGLVSRNLS